MSKAFIIEIESRTAGIVAKYGHRYRFFSAERIFDRLDGREFRSARDAERPSPAARTRPPHALLRRGILTARRMSRSFLWRIQARYPIREESQVVASE